MKKSCKMQKIYQRVFMKCKKQVKNTIHKNKYSAWKIYQTINIQERCLKNLQITTIYGM